MKFRDKDGNMFEDIIVAWANFCEGSKEICYPECPFDYIPDGSSCCEYAQAHPAEAARLMGYEVVEENPEDCDETPDTCFYWGLSDCMSACKEKSVFEPKPKKEANMTREEAIRKIEYGLEMETSEPTPFGQLTVVRTEALRMALSALLGQQGAVEKEAPMKQDKPLADWTLGELKEYCSDKTCSKCPFDGERLCGHMFDDPPEEWDLTAPPRFTEDEVAAARVLLAGGIEEVERGDHSDGDLLAYSCRNESGARRWWGIPHELFPSLAQNTCVKLAEIVGGAE